jgi:hypothetical protein
MKNTFRSFYLVLFLALISSCSSQKANEQLQSDLKSANLLRGDITLCISEKSQFGQGQVNFGSSCEESVRDNFNLALALLHSFEYSEAEKVFAKVIDADPRCVMAYWGVAMSNFHPLWFPPTKDELSKGAKIVAIARSLDKESERESNYLEAVAVMYDDWDKLDHKARVLKFEKASENIYEKYPSDLEAAIFYALSLRAASDPADKTFAKQRKAGEILSGFFTDNPEHPGIAHYIIHAYDYPELADLALPAARKYAAIAGSSAHALHMPSHIFTRLGLWDEAIQSNTNSITAAKCYAESSGMDAAWDEEIHALDYRVYAYLQQGRDSTALADLNYIRSIENVSPFNSKCAYTFAAVPTRYALERKNWEEAAKLKLMDQYPYENFPWERSVLSFGKVLGGVHTKQMKIAEEGFAELTANHAILKEKNKTYEANQVLIQITAADAWIKLSKGNKADAVKLMTQAAEMEEATEKHPVTPGEVVPARELLADMYMELNDFKKALENYEKDLERHAGRYNAISGAGVAAWKAGDKEKATKYFDMLKKQSQFSENKRTSLMNVESIARLSRN